jgi:putative MATE family efflux protein
MPTAAGTLGLVPAAPAPPAVEGLAASTRVLLEAPIPGTLLRLAAPNVVVITVQAAINVLEAVYVGWLGRDALAGIALVFPLVMLMQTMSAGGMGVGIASAIARALGAGRRRDADALVVHALVIALVFGAAFTAGMLWGGPRLYRAMGGTDGALAAALTYSNVVFAGAGAFWLFNTLGSVLRGAGNMRLPAVVVVAGGPLLLVLSPALIWGWGPFPRLGIAGAGVAVVIYYCLGSVVLGVALRSRGNLVRLSLRRVRLRVALFREILRVGLPGALNTVQTNLTVVVLTGLVGAFGTVALAGYGTGARLEYLQIPLVFGLGSALVTMVGTNVGAGQLARARRIALVGGALAFALTETIGLAAALFPGVWMGLFTRDPAVAAAGSAYLRVVGPSYGFFGLGLALYFASQGAGRVLWPLVAGFMRLVLAAVGGSLAIHWLGGGPRALSVVIALAFVLFGVTLLSAVRGGGWRR